MMKGARLRKFSRIEGVELSGHPYWPVPVTAIAFSSQGRALVRQRAYT